MIVQLDALNVITAFACFVMMAIQHKEMWLPNTIMF